MPGAELAPGAFALVAMGAVFGSAARATFTFIVFAFEITRDYNAVLPLMLVCVIADAIAIRFLPNSIMTEKLSRRGLDTHYEYESIILKRLRVREIMARDVVTVAPDETVRSVANRFLSGDPRLMRYHALPIVNREGRLVGLVTQGDILRVKSQLVAIVISRSAPVFYHRARSDIMKIAWISKLCDLSQLQDYLEHRFLWKVCRTVAIVPNRS